MTVSVCVFCGTKDGNDKKFTQDAYELGKRIAQANYRLVYGAGHIGMMGAVSQGAIDHRTSKFPNILGIIPMNLRNRENAQEVRHEIRTTGTLDERKRQMFRESDAFVVLPGGFGTLDELFEGVTLSQIGGHTSTRIPVKDKPTFVLNTLGYYDDLIAQLDKMVTFGFLTPENRMLVTVVNSIDELMPRLSELG